MPRRSRSTTAWRCTFRRRTPTPARTCSSCRRTAARWCCSCCWRAAWRPRPRTPVERPLARAAPRRARRVHQARVPQRQARPGAGRGGGRPDRRQHRSRGALGRPFADRRVLARGERARRGGGRVAIAGRGDAGLSGRGDRLPAARRCARPAAGASTSACTRVLGAAQRGALLREGIHVVLAGQPNVGKSSLLNALAGAELAIVTPIPGTTRDKVAQTIQIEGRAAARGRHRRAALADDALDEVERIGIAAQLGRDRPRRRGAVPARPDARHAARVPAGAAGASTRSCRR